MEKQDYQAITRKISVFALAFAVVCVLIITIVIPAWRGRAVEWSIVVLTLIATLISGAFGLWLARRFSVYDPAMLQGVRRQLGETRWQHVQRSIFAAPRHLPIFRVNLILGLFIILCSAVIAVLNRTEAIGLGLIGLGMSASSAAELLPKARNYTAGMMRLCGLVLTFAGAIVVWTRLLR